MILPWFLAHLVEEISGRNDQFFSSFLLRKSLSRREIPVDSKRRYCPAPLPSRTVQESPGSPPALSKKWQSREFSSFFASYHPISLHLAEIRGEILILEIATDSNLVQLFV